MHSIHRSAVAPTFQRWSWSTSLTRSVLVALCMLGATVNSEAAPILLADFRAELSVKYSHPNSGALIFEDLAEPVIGRPDLSDADGIVGTWIGHVNVDLSRSGMIRLTAYDKISQGTGIADYQTAVFSITNIVFNGERQIAGVTVLDWEGMFDDGTGLHPQPTIDFTPNSVTITYDVATIDEYCTDPKAAPSDCFWFTLKDGGVSTFQLELSPSVPEPALIAFFGVGLAGLGLRSWRQRRRS